MKINVTEKDMTYNGLGFNNINFIHNVAPRISQWLLEIYQSTEITEATLIANKLRKIAEIIDDEEKR